MRQNVFETLSLGASKCVPVDSVLLAVMFVLTLVGLVRVFSASGVMAANKYNDSWYFLKRQAMCVCGGLAE